MKNHASELDLRTVLTSIGEYRNLISNEAADFTIISSAGLQASERMWSNGIREWMSECVSECVSENEWVSECVSVCESEWESEMVPHMACAQDTSRPEYCTAHDGISAHWKGKYRRMYD